MEDKDEYKKYFLAWLKSHKFKQIKQSMEEENSKQDKNLNKTWVEIEQMANDIIEANIVNSYIINDISKLVQQSCTKDELIKKHIKMMNSWFLISKKAVEQERYEIASLCKQVIEINNDELIKALQNKNCTDEELEIVEYIHTQFLKKYLGI